MSGILSKVMGLGAEGILREAGNLADKFITTDGERNEFKRQIAELVTRRTSEVEETLRAELGARRDIIVAEMAQGDAYTKRARPTVVYAGIVIFALDAAVRAIQMSLGVGDVPTTYVPSEFALAWGSVVGLWVLGRSAEKRGAGNAIISAITGTPQSTSPKEQHKVSSALDW